MLLVTLNAVFALIFLSFAPNAFKRARPLIQIGWEVINAEVQKPDYRQHVESRRKISEASWFLLGGIFWLATAIGAAGFGLYFIAELLRLY